MNTGETRNVLLLGASGFVGGAILRSLEADGKYRIMALQHSKPLDVVASNVHIIEGSLASIDFTQLPFAPEIIIHAARNRTGRFGKIGRRLMAFKGSSENRHILERVRSLPQPPLLIYCSGSLMYGSHKDILIDESFPVRPVSFAKQYVEAERPFMDAIDSKDVPVLMLRLPWVIGNGSWFRWNYLQPMTERGFVPVYGTGDNIMTFLDVDMIGAAIARLSEMRVTGVLNLFNPQYLKQSEWAKLLADLSGMPAKMLEGQELEKSAAAVREAFATEIRLGSLYPEVQRKLLPLHLPLREIAAKHLASLQRK